MKPYYERDGITIYHADCRDIVPTLPEQSVDVVLADPNYGETSLDWDRRMPDWPTLVLPVINQTGCLWSFGSFRYFFDEREAFRAYRLAQEIIWEKHNGSGLQADRFKRVHELLVQFYPAHSRWSDLYKQPVYTMDATARTVRRKALPPQHQGARGPTHYVSEDGGPRLMRSVIPVRSCHGSAVHPTQKPEGIVHPALAYSLPPSGLLLDPFMGSGTSLVVARAMGARAIGIEWQEQYCEAAARRLEQPMQSPLL